MAVPAILPDQLPNGLQVIKKLLPQNLYSLKSPNGMNPTRIVVHNTYNDAPAINEINYMISNNLEVSFHFAVDDVNVVQGIALNRNAWHSGDGGSGLGNRQGIAIEICYSKSGGERFNLAEINACKLIAYLLYGTGWDIDKITKHQDYSGKYCPHRTLDLGWQRFLDMCRLELNKLLNTKEVYPVGTVVYNITDVLLESTVYENSTKAILPKESKSKVYKYFSKDSVLWMALGDMDDKPRSPAAWTKEIDKFVLNLPSEIDKEVSVLKKKIIDLESIIIEKDAKIGALNEELLKYKRS